MSSLSPERNERQLEQMTGDAIKKFMDDLALSAGSKGRNSLDVLKTAVLKILEESRGAQISTDTEEEEESQDDSTTSRTTPLLANHFLQVFTDAGLLRENQELMRARLRFIIVSLDISLTSLLVASEW